MSLGANSLLLTLMVASQSLPLPAQQNPCLDRAVAVNVLTDKRHLVKGLTAANFRGKFRGQPVDIVSATYDTGPRRVLIMFDTSSSMLEGVGKWKSAITAAESLVSLSRDSFGLLTFSRQVETRIDFGQGRQTVADALASLGRQGFKGVRKTALLDALASGIRLFGATSDGDTIYLISDGGDNASQTRASAVRSALLSGGIRLFAFLPTESVSDVNLTPEEASGPETFQKLVEESGGDHIFFFPGQDVGYGPSKIHDYLSRRDNTAASLASESLGREIDEFYQLGVKLRGPVDKPRDWQLDVIEPATGKKAGHVRVVYPRELAPCEASILTRKPASGP